MEKQELKELEQELDKAFKIRQSFAAIKRIMDNKDGVEYIAQGTGRLVYKVSEDKVLKIAKSPKGIAQNETEADWGLKNYGVAAEWYDVSDEGIWIESEICSKVKISDFKKELGFTFQYFCDCLRYFASQRDRRRGYAVKPENFDETYENEFINAFYQYIADFGVPTGDLCRISSYGRNHNGEIVLVDYGLNEDVFNNYYRK